MSTVFTSTKPRYVFQGRTLDGQYLWWLRRYQPVLNMPIILIRDPKNFWKVS